MVAPYWGELPPQDLAGNPVKKDTIALHGSANNYRSASHFQGTPTISMQNAKPEIHSHSTQSSLGSPISSSFSTGLAPRPPSFTTDTVDYGHGFEERRRQRRNRHRNQVFDENKIITPPLPTAPEVPLKQINDYDHLPRTERPSLYHTPTHQGSFEESQTMDGYIFSGPRTADASSHTNMEAEQLSTGGRHGGNMKPRSKFAPQNQPHISHLSRKNSTGEEAPQSKTLLLVNAMRNEVYKHGIDFAPDRSPLQRLELTLDRINKVEKSDHNVQTDQFTREAEAADFSVKTKTILGTQPILNSHENLHHKLAAVKNNTVYDSRLASNDIYPGSSNEFFQLGIMEKTLPPKVNQIHSLEMPPLNPVYSATPHGNATSGQDCYSDYHYGRNLNNHNGIAPAVGGNNLKYNKSHVGFSVANSDETKKLHEPPRPKDGLRVEHFQKSESIQGKELEYVPQQTRDKELPKLPLETSQPGTITGNTNSRLGDYKSAPRRTFSKLSKIASEKLSPKFPKNERTTPNASQIEGKTENKTSNITPPDSEEIYIQKSHFTKNSDQKFARSPVRDENYQSQENFILSPRLDEWKKGGVAQLSGTFLELCVEDQKLGAESDKSWWDSKNNDRIVNPNVARKAEAYEGEYDDNIVPTRFKPPLFLVSGPMLRYCGLRREVPRNFTNSTQLEREIWKGTVMIVCQDSHSSYELAPTLRLFLQPVSLLPPPPMRVDDSGLAPEYIDPIAGISRIGRDGRTLYVRPVEEIDEERDLSREESADGLYDMGRNIPEVNYTKSSNSTQKIDGEKAGKYKEVRGFRLHSEYGMTFWRFNLEIELKEHQQRIAYRINRGPSTGFWVPSRGQAMKIVFHSCNGFSRNVDPNPYCGPDPMWRDILNTHQTQPFHVMLGGGNQIFNDDIIHESRLCRAWLNMRDTPYKQQFPFSSNLQHELETLYLNHYCAWFSQGLFGLAVSQIPMINIIDDHEIFSGFGSYEDDYMRSPVMSGIGAVAYKYYMLFQHQSCIDEGEDTEPSWVLGVRPGPYIPELSRSIFSRLGRPIAYLGIDCRTERTSDQILSPQTYQKILERLEREIILGDTKHLIVSMSIPNPYLWPTWAENTYPAKESPSSRIFGRKELRKKQSTANTLDNSDIPNDLVANWIARNYKDERRWFIEELQDLAAAKSVRVTLLGSGVHIGAVGILYSNPKLGIPKDRDFRYMPNIFSSAIANSPASDILCDLLDKKSKIHHLDAETNEDILSIFSHDVNGQPRSNRRFFNRRNWCAIQVYHSISCSDRLEQSEQQISQTTRRSHSLIRRFSHSQSPRFSQAETPFSVIPLTRGRSVASRPPLSNPQFFNDFNGKQISGTSPGSRRGSMSSERQNVVRRTLSLTRKDFNIVEQIRRRSSSRKRSDQPDYSVYQYGRRDELPEKEVVRENPFVGSNEIINISSEVPKIASENTNTSEKSLLKTPQGGMHKNDGKGLENIKKRFRRLSIGIGGKETKKHGQLNDINLENGLDICLNIEISPRDPAGTTIPYRLVVPALVYNEADNEAFDFHKSRIENKRVHV
ncbi:hypothetical protein BGHDH14_bgh04825 [Blumeria hordei DH14]|uniref:PhoD-like phosphatase domain-containing protein n=1 Tax=Blumeria graminis f. sp. hordei (strain DH14) TaxID=546991 RepID=N1JAU4_BLUG1|nr:hypothetical protein BGHDH14_bgh04825 [Blumeria hordei DH14]